MAQKENYESNNIPVFQHMPVANCCGCGICVNSCPRKIIRMQEDSLGFLYPSVDAAQCIHCNSCVNMCPQLNVLNKYVTLRKTFAGSSKNTDIVETASSGGIFEELAVSFMGGKVTPKENRYVSGVVWNDNFKSTKHIVTNNLLDIEKLKRSKYVQSDKSDIYIQIRNILQDKNNEVLFVGCPCEVAALRVFLKREYNNLYAIDFVCKGATSRKVMREYVENLEKKTNSSIEYINMRYCGGDEWIPQWMYIVLKNGKKILKPFYSTEFGRAFHIMQRPACFNCKFVGFDRQADITLGDYHCVKQEAPFYNSKGTSILVINTEKGNILLALLKACDVRIFDADYNDIAKHNKRIDGPWRPMVEYTDFCWNFKNKGLHTAVMNSLSLKKKLIWILPESMKEQIKNIRKKIIRKGK